MRSWQQVCHHSAISCDPKTCACKGYDTECWAQDLFRTCATERVWDMSQKFTQHGLWRFCQRNHVRFSRCVQLNPGMRNTSMCIHTHLQCIWILFVNICTLKYMHICRSMSTYRYLLVYTLHTRSCEPNYKEKPAMRLSDDVNSGVCRWLEDISVFCRNVHFFVIRGYPLIDT